MYLYNPQKKHSFCYNKDKLYYPNSQSIASLHLCLFFQIFLDGISGVGKSTMARLLCKDLQSKGLSAKAYIEFDYTNPIDFYCVAYYTSGEYEMLCAENSENENAIRSYTIDAGTARLIHYFNEDTPLFDEP